jgi:hypothetical protein
MHTLYSLCADKCIMCVWFGKPAFSFVAAPSSPYLAMAGLSGAMEVDDQSKSLQSATAVDCRPDPQKLYCGRCWKTCGNMGHWQKLGTRRWIYFCKSCNFELWRDHTKLEEFDDYHTRNVQYIEYLHKVLHLEAESDH